MKQAAAICRGDGGCRSCCGSNGAIVSVTPQTRLVFLFIISAGFVATCSSSFPAFYSPPFFCAPPSPQSGGIWGGGGGSRS